jgi:TolB-like protein
MSVGGRFSPGARQGADFADLGERSLKNIAQPVRVYAIAPATPHAAERNAPRRLSIVVLPFANVGGDPEQHISSTASPKA